jgi:hypothetical protein
MREAGEWDGNEKWGEEWDVGFGNSDLILRR